MLDKLAQTIVTEIELDLTSRKRINLVANIKEHFPLGSGFASAFFFANSLVVGRMRPGFRDGRISVLSVT